MYIRRIEIFIGRNNENLSNILFITKMSRHDLDQNYKYAINHHTLYPYYYKPFHLISTYSMSMFVMLYVLSFESSLSYDAPW